MGEIGQVLLLGVFTTLFSEYAVSGELRRHRMLGRIALWTSLVLNWGYTGLCVYELYVGAGAHMPRRLHKVSLAPAVRC